ncbi:hypothetical protein [Flavobacterium sp. UMI-01]|uniref:hypothetical protein n=2 Tax=Flavobacterium sp. UMI-01 TaxID=1441053 RepID=UPI001C7D4AF7|nr:hypothetical protein [Flavobacterium sp. UMI-01]
MEKEIFTIEELLSMGFKEQTGDELDNGGYYRWWETVKHHSSIDITYEYDAAGNFTSGYVEISGHVLNGRPVTKSDVQLLLEIM